MTVRRFDSIRAAESVIRAVEGRGTASQTYVVLRAVERAFWRCAWARLNPVALIRACVSEGFRVYAVLDGDNVVLAAPLEHAENGWRFVCGKYVELDYTDALYGAYPANMLRSAFEIALKRMRDDGIRRIEWRYLSEDSISNSLICGMRSSVAADCENYAIELKEESFDGYLSALGGVARHNLRKGLRWASEKGIRFDFYSSCGYGSSIDLKTLTESRRIYRRRQAERYGHRGPIAALYFAALNYISLSIPGDRGYLAVLRIGGRIAATMEGYVNRSRRALEMPRLSMDSSFSEYGPGRLLVAECVRWMLAETDLRILDLCRGDERYKRELGGRRYLTRCVALELGGGV